MPWFSIKDFRLFYCALLEKCLNKGLEPTFHFTFAYSKSFGVWYTKYHLTFSSTNKYESKLIPSFAPVHTANVHSHSAVIL